LPARRLKAYHYEEDYKVGQMELYINNSWTECYANAYIAEAIACSEYGNHACIYTQGATAEEADSKLRGALCELNLAPKNACQERAEVKESAELEGGNIDCFERRLKVS
jgi:hypothetical protein